MDYDGPHIYDEEQPIIDLVLSIYDTNSEVEPFKNFDTDLIGDVDISSPSSCYYFIKQ